MGASRPQALVYQNSEAHTCTELLTIIIIIIVIIIVISIIPVQDSEGVGWVLCDVEPGQTCDNLGVGCHPSLEMQMIMTTIKNYSNAIFLRGRIVSLTMLDELSFNVEIQLSIITWRMSAAHCLCSCHLSSSVLRRRQLAGVVRVR